MRLPRTLIQLGAAALLVAPLSAQVPTTGPTVYNTGSDAAGNALPWFVPDPHWSMVGPVAGAETTNKWQWWVPWGGAFSTWIAPPGSVALGSPVGLYTYQTTFDMSAYSIDGATFFCKLSADDECRMFLNSTLIAPWGNTNSGYASINASTGFLPGINTLTVEVNNTFATGINPTGLLCDRIEVLAWERPVLTVTGLVAGGLATLTVTKLNPGDRVMLAASTRGQGPTNRPVPNCGVMPIALSLPFISIPGQFTANALGEVMTHAPVPALPGLGIAVQALNFTGCVTSNAVLQTVQ